LGIIDSLSKGFQKVHRNWWVILIPVVLDLFLWLGPRAAVDQLVKQALTGLQSELGDTSALVDAEDWEQALDLVVTEIVPEYNAFSALRVGALGVPSLLTWGGAQLGAPSSYEVLWVTFLLLTDMPDLLLNVSSMDLVGVATWQIPSQGVWLLITFFLTVVGITIGATYITTLAGAVGDSGRFWPRVYRLSLRFAFFWVLRFIALVATGIPMLAVLVAIAAFSPGLASLLGTIVLGLYTWVSFYGIFFIASLAMNDVSVWRGIWNSFNIVLRNFWPTFGLFLLINLIGGGLTILWQQLSRGSLLTVVAILGNSYIGSSLVAASLVFYQDRYLRWQELIAELLRRTKRLV
jgi:hypothetical protein